MAERMEESLWIPTLADGFIHLLVKERLYCIVHPATNYTWFDHGNRNMVSALNRTHQSTLRIIGAPFQICPGHVAPETVGATAGEDVHHDQFARADRSVAETV